MFVFVDDTQRDINLQLSSAKKSVVRLSQHAPITPPNSLLHLNSLELLSMPTAICQYKNQLHVYCSLFGSHKILRIDRQGNQFEWVSYSSDTRVESICAKNDKIFVMILKKINSRQICVYDLSGQLITSWHLSDRNNIICNKLVVIGNQVIVCNVDNKRLTVYSLTGDIIRHIPCTQLRYYYSIICEAGDDSVIITNWWSDKVYKLSLTTGQIEWTSTDVRYPRAVVCYADQYVLVAADYSSDIIVLDINTGKKCYMMGLYSFILKNHGFCCRKCRYTDIYFYVYILLVDFGFFLLFILASFYYQKFVG